MPTYTGTTGNDTLAGGSGADTMIGLAGNDTYTVNQLGDVIVEDVGAGIDTVLTSVLDDLSTYSLEPWVNVENLGYTGTLASLLKGNALNNTISANAAASAADSLNGAAGNDSLYGFGGNDQLTGGTGNDMLDGGTGADSMIGGSGNDVFLVDSTTDRVYEYGGGGFDTVISAVARDLGVPWLTWVEGLTYNGTTAATLQGNAGGNLITSLSSTADVLNGYAGSDTLDGGVGADSVNGGAGNDFYFVSSIDVIGEAADEGIDTLVGTQADLGLPNLAATVENLFYTGSGSVAVKGNGLDNLLSGGSGNNTVTGSDGQDTVLGGAGSDSVSGGNGNDVLYGASSDGYVYLPGQRLVADAVADTLSGGTGNDRYLIDSTLDTVSESTSGGTLDVVISTIDNSLARHANIEALVLQAASTAYLAQGTAGGDVLVGNEVDNLLEGGAGDDTLSGFVDVDNLATPQSDVLKGGDGNDVLLAFDYTSGFGGSRELSLFGGAGNDFYVLGMRADGYGGQDSGGTDTAVMLASGTIDNLEGVNHVFLYGADAGQDARARAAVNGVYAAANFDAAYGGSFGAAYNAVGNGFSNRIVGNSLDNQLTGGGGNDSLTGNNGNDTLEGGAGVDSLVGGAGDDWYYLDTGDVAIEASSAGFDVLASLTITSFAGFANFEGLQYLGGTAVSLNRGSSNTSADFLGGGSGNDTIGGFGGNDTLDGGNGGDTLSGEIGDDALRGGAGNDAMDGGGNWDRLEGGDGNDSGRGGDGNDTLEGDAGDDQLYGENNNDTLVGGAGGDELWGGASTREGSTTAQGNHLWGDEEFGSGSGTLDFFAFDGGSIGADNAAIESFTGSGLYNFIAGSTVGDFERGVDLLAVAGNIVGNLDNTLDNVTEKTAAGGTFSSSSELVLVRANVADTFAFSNTSFFDAIDAAAVSAVIGNANAPIASNETRLFVVDDGNHSALLLFLSNNGDAAVTLDELYLVSVVTGQNTLTASDFGLF